MVNKNINYNIKIKCIDYRTQIFKLPVLKFPCHNYEEYFLNDYMRFFHCIY